MPLAKDRELTSITTKAHKHMKKIVSDFNKLGLPESNMHWLSELILSQKSPIGRNGKAHIVGQSQPSTIITGEVSGVMVGTQQKEQSDVPQL